MFTVRVSLTRLIRGYLDNFPFNLWPQPELSFVRPPCLPGEPQLVFFGVPGPGRSKECDAEPKKLRVNVGKGSVGAEPAAAMLPASPYVDADVDILETLGDLHEGGVKSEEVLCYEGRVIWMPLDEC